MQKHIVTCVECGRQFDANRGGYYDKKSRRYTCKECGRKINAARNKSGSSASKVTKKEVTIAGIVLKFAIGLLFIACGFSSPSDGWTVTYFLTCLILGGALVFWGILSYKKMKADEAEKHRIEVKNRIAAQERPKTCPSCGAITKGDVCEYCGSPLP